LCVCVCVCVCVRVSVANSAYYLGFRGNKSSFSWRHLVKITGPCQTKGPL
jgi:hypothetical protein